MVFCLLLMLYQDTQVYEPRTFLEPDVQLPSFNSRDISLRDLLRQISMEKKVNIVVDQGVNIQVTLQMYETTLNKLLNMLVTVYDLDVSVVDGIVFVKNPPPAPVPERINDILYDADGGTISFDLSGLSLELFARRVTEQTGYNLLPHGQGLRGELKGLQAPLPLERGLSLFLESNGLALTVEEDVWFYGRPAPPESPQPTGDGTVIAVPQVDRLGRLKPGTLQVTDDLVSARFVNKPIQAIIAEFAELGVVPMAVHGAPDAPVSIDVTDLSVDQFFKLLLSGSDFGFMEQEGVYVIGAQDKTSLSDRRIVKLKYLNAEMVTQNLPDTIKEGVSVNIIKELNSILITGERSRVLNLEQLIFAMDQPVAQVLIEVVVVDYTFSDEQEFGVGLTNGANQLIPGVDLTLDGFRDQDGDFRVRRLPSNFALRIRALETEGTARIISKPHVAALNGHEATIKIGTKQFYRLQSEELVGNENPRVRTSQEIKEVEANIFLKITPWVSGNGEVTTLIEPSFTNFQGTINDNIPPPISSRELSSTVRLKDGETIILGGLIENVDNLNDSGVPLLRRIPLLGRLFQERKREKRQAELVIYITPHIYYGNEGSVAFIEEREGLEYQLDARKQKDGEKARSPLKESWFKRWRKRREEKRHAGQN